MTCSLTVYTATYGGLHHVKTPLFRSPHVEYVCWTDDPSNKVPGYDLIVQHMPVPQDPQRSILYHKTHPPEGASLWVNANVQVVGDPRELASDQLSLALHPRHRCLFQLATELAGLLSHKSKKLVTQMTRYMADGMPVERPLWDTSVIYRPADLDPEWSDFWWAEICEHTSFDKVSLPYALLLAGQAVQPMDPQLAENCFRRREVQAPAVRVA